MLRTIFLKDIKNKESWRLWRSEAYKCFNFWQRLGLPELKPAVEKFWAIRTKGNGRSFHGKRRSASESQCLWFESAINKDMGPELRYIRTLPAWPATTKLWMTLDCSRIAKETAMVSGIFVQGTWQTLLYSSKWQDYERSEKIFVANLPRRNKETTSDRFGWGELIES